MSDETKRIVREETWEPSYHGPFAYVDAPNGRPIATNAFHADATIAACAPEALRMLLALEGAIAGMYHGLCPVCRNGAHGSRCDEPGAICHTDDCAWLALMRKAGLR